MEKKILCIIRASTEKQETESQKQELIAYCIAKGFAVEEMAFIEVAGASARKLNDKYIQMLEDIKATLLSSKTIRAVALWHLNRLGRVESKLHEMKEFFVTNKIQVYCKNPDFTLLDDDGSESAAGGLAFSVYASMVKYETDEMFAKMKRGKERNKTNGIYAGGKIKFGYTLDATKHFIINEDDAKTIRLIFELYATGKYSFYSLIEELRARGITKNGMKITYEMIQNALSEETYYKGINGKMPLIDKDLFDRCAAIKANYVAVKRTKESRNINFAVGLLKCSCGNNFVASGDFYRCYSKMNKRRKKKVVECDSPVIRMDILDDIIWLVTRLLHQKFLMGKDIVSIEEQQEKINVLTVKVSTAQKELSSIKDRTEKLEDAYYVEGDMTEAQFKKRLAGLHSKEQQEESQIRNYRSEIDEIEKIIKQIETPDDDRYIQSLMLSHLDENEIDDRKKIKELMFMHIDKITVNKLMKGNHKCIEITITSKSGLSFLFLYDSWINSHRKDECNLFYEGKPVYELDGHITKLNQTVRKMLYQKIGLPVLTTKELGEAAARYAITQSSSDVTKGKRGREQYFRE